MRRPAAPNSANIGLRSTDGIAVRHPRERRPALVERRHFADTGDEDGVAAVDCGTASE